MNETNSTPTKAEKAAKTRAANKAKREQAAQELAAVQEVPVETPQPARYGGMASMLSNTPKDDVRMLTELNRGLGKLCKGAGELGEVFYQGSAALTEALKQLRGDLYWTGIQDLMKKGLTEEEAVEYIASL